jgi:hypothetical protein
VFMGNSPTIVTGEFEFFGQKLGNAERSSFLANSLRHRTYPGEPGNGLYRPGYCHSRPLWRLGHYRKSVDVLTRYRLALPVMTTMWMTVLDGTGRVNHQSVVR